MSEEEDKKEKPKRTGRADYSANFYIVTDPETIDALTTSTATLSGLTADLSKKVGAELRSDVDALRVAVGGIEQTTEKLTPLLPLSDLDTEELMSKAAYIIIDEKLAHVRTIAENAKKYSKEAKESAESAVNTASNIRNIHIFILVLYAIVSLILILVSIWTFLV